MFEFINILLLYLFLHYYYCITILNTFILYDWIDFYIPIQISSSPFLNKYINSYFSEQELSLKAEELINEFIEEELDKSCELSTFLITKQESIQEIKQESIQEIKQEIKELIIESLDEPIINPLEHSIYNNNVKINEIIFENPPVIKLKISKKRIES